MLDIRWSMNITPQVLREFLKSCPNLKCLGVYQSSHINCNAMAELLDCVPKLEILEFGAFGKASISESFLFPNLVRHCPQLKALSLINFLSLNPYTDGQLFGRLLNGCSRLERINLCEPDPTLTSLIGSIRVTTTAKITQRWQCVLPAPDVTLDAVMNQLSYLLWCSTNEVNRDCWNSSYIYIANFNGIYDYNRVYSSLVLIKDVCIFKSTLNVPKKKIIRAIIYEYINILVIYNTMLYIKCNGAIE